MTAEELAEIVRLTRLLVPPQVEAILPAKLDGGSGRCLPSSRLGMEVLRYFGVDAVPLPTRALAVNAAWQEWMHGPEQGQGEMPDPAWSVMVGYPLKEGRGVDMHLVLLVEGKTLLDLNSGQFSRPERDMPVPVTKFLPATRRRTETGQELWHAGAPLKGDGRIDYVEHPSPPAWRHAPDWRKVGRHAGPIIRAIRAELG